MRKACKCKSQAQDELCNLLHGLHLNTRFNKLAQNEQSHEGRPTFAHLAEKEFVFLKKIAPLHLQDVRSRMIDLLTESELRALGSAFAKINAQLRATE